MIIVESIDFAPAYAMRPSYPSVAKKALEKGMRQTWRSSHPLKSGSVSIECDVTDEGTIYNPDITLFSGNDQHDAECLEAFCGLSPLDHGSIWGMNLTSEHISETFGVTIPPSITPSKDAPEITHYLREYPASDGSVIVHKIPPFILSRYPDLITKEEFSSPENLIRIAPDVAKKPIDSIGRRLSQPDYVWAVRAINGWWSKHLQDSGPVTRKTILEHAESVSPHLWGGAMEKTSITPNTVN
jgi:hypothetical protein